MRFLVSVFSAMVLLGGCAEKSAFDMFKMDQMHEKAVEQLRTGTIVQSLETKAIISSVYLNAVRPDEYKDGEYFVTALYFEKKNLEVKKWNLESYGYSLTLNGKAPSSIEELKEDDPRRTLIPIQNRWNRYYLLRFEPTAELSLALRLENNQTGSVELNYQK